MQKIVFTAIIVLFSLLGAPNSFGQVPTTPNSGNPAFPVPQFLSYDSPISSYGNLGTRNGAGVTHAEMEQTILDAWQIMANRFDYTGETLNGVQYIKGNEGCPYDCTEGDGYALLAAAYMADKNVFDGLWLRTHDVRRVKQPRYIDGIIYHPNYKYGVNTLTDRPSPDPVNNPEGSGDAAADGDFDVAFALLVAWMQWGEFMGINDSRGVPISYKKEALDVINGLVEINNRVEELGDNRVVSGDIGLDGYIKSGNTFPELTTWGTTQTNIMAGLDPDMPAIPEYGGNGHVYADYAAPAYFYEFAQMLKEQDPQLYAQNISQFERATASSDWLMGDLYSQSPNYIPNAGEVRHAGNNQFTFTSSNPAEDVRHPWRNLLNPMWHGDPVTTWNPVTHQVETGGNTFQKDMGLRYARFLYDTRQAPWGNSCVTVHDRPYWGPSQIMWDYNLDGSNPGTFPLNWRQGTSSPAAVLAQDYELMAEMYRQLEIEWDVQFVANDARYLTSEPVYFHGWFRLLGLLVLSGNKHAPLNMARADNMKVYMSVDKTFAFEGDDITYTLSWRNYGSVAAQGVVVVDTLPADFVYISSTGGGTYSSASHTVTWNIGSVPGVQSATGASNTQGSAELVVRINNASQTQYANKASIISASGRGWTTNEYPNNISPIMQRNLVDIAKRALIIDHTASGVIVKPGEEMDYTINFENTSEAGWIKGGRPGVHFSYAHPGTEPIGSTHYIQVRLFHDADEAYIDYGNYRISYFLFDEEHRCIGGEGGDPNCTNGWGQRMEILEGVPAEGLKIIQEEIVPGSDARGKWNQRVIVQFANPADPGYIPNLTTVNPFISLYDGIDQRIHRGGTKQLRAVWRFFDYNSQINWEDDWSWDPEASGDAGSYYWPITNDWTDINNPDIPVNTWHPKSCLTASHTVDNVLIEEWDGYTWRRIAGNGPLPGRAVDNVVIRDTIPQGFSFVGFTGENPLGVAPQINGNVITWEIPHMQIAQGGTINYTLKADGACPMPFRQTVNKAWIEADKESPIASDALVTITCGDLPGTAPPIANPNGGIFTQDLMVTLTSATEGATIYYTLDESPVIPGNPGVLVYQPGTPIPITESTILKAIAAKEGHELSVPIEEIYIREVIPLDSAAKPIATPPPTEFYTSISVALTTATAGGQIYYTLDGSVPLPGSGGTLLYTAAFTLTDTTLVRAITVKEGIANSSEFSGTYTLLINKVKKPIATPSGEPSYTFISSPNNPGSVSVTLTVETESSSILYTLDGTDPASTPGGSTMAYNGTPLTITQTTTVKAIGIREGWNQSDVMVAQYQVNEVLDPVAVDRAWIIDGNSDGRGDSIFISFRDQVQQLPDQVSEIFWPDGLTSPMVVTHTPADPAGSPIQFFTPDHTTLVIDLSANPFAYGATEAGEPAPTLTLPGNEAFYGQTPVIEDGIGPVILEAVKISSDLEYFGILHQDGSLTFQINPDTLIITLSEKMDPRASVAPWKSLFAVYDKCDSSKAMPLEALSDLDYFTADGQKFKVGFDFSNSNTGVKVGDCISLLHSAPYRDIYGNPPEEGMVTVTGSQREYGYVSTAIMAPIIGDSGIALGTSKFQGEKIRILDENGNLVEYRETMEPGHWIPPAFMDANGIIDENARAHCDAGIPETQGFQPFPANCLSSVVIFAEQAYTAEVAVYDHLGKVIHSSQQSFGYCGELRNPARMQPDGFMSFLIWDQKDEKGSLVGSGVYPWRVLYRFADGRVNLKTYKQGIARGEPPPAGCARP